MWLRRPTRCHSAGGNRQPCCAPRARAGVGAAGGLARAGPLARAGDRHPRSTAAPGRAARARRQARSHRWRRALLDPAHPTRPASAAPLGRLRGHLRLPRQRQRAGRERRACATDATCSARSSTRSTRAARGATRIATIPGMTTAAISPPLVDACRGGCRRLPAFAAVRPFVELETSRASVLALNHELDPVRRDAALRAWVAHAVPDEHGLRWYERTAAASQSVVVFALLALADRPPRHPGRRRCDLPRLLPLVCLRRHDARQLRRPGRRRGRRRPQLHRALPRPGAGGPRLHESVVQAATRQLALPHSERHGVLLGCMIAMYLSKDSARAPDLRAASESVARRAVR